MRFCTTCGRNFDNSIVECPHDGTPLFEMHGGDDDAAEELQSDGGAPIIGNAADGVIEAPHGAVSEDAAAQAPGVDDEDDAAESADEDALAAPNFVEVDDDSFGVGDDFDAFDMDASDFEDAPADDVVDAAQQDAESDLFGGGDDDAGADAEMDAAPELDADAPELAED